MWGHFRKQAEGVLRVDKSGIDDFRVCRGKGEGCGWCLWMHLHCAACSTMDLKIVPHSSMVMENFGEVLEKRGTCSPYVVHLRAQLTKLDELTWSKKNSAMRRGVLTDADGRSLHVMFMAQVAEELQAEVGGMESVSCRCVCVCVCDL